MSLGLVDAVGTRVTKTLELLNRASERRDPRRPGYCPPTVRVPATVA